MNTKTTSDENYPKSRHSVKLTTQILSGYTWKAGSIVMVTDSVERGRCRLLLPIVARYENLAYFSSYRCVKIRRMVFTYWRLLKWRKNRAVLSTTHWSWCTITCYTTSQLFLVSGIYRHIADHIQGKSHFDIIHSEKSRHLQCTLEMVQMRWLKYSHAM